MTAYPPPHKNPNWHDPARVDELKRLWAAGLSASKIAARLGGITRNSVISKVHRLGLAGRPTTSRITNKSKKWKLPPAPRPQLSPAAEAIKAIKRDGLPLPPPAETDIARVSFVDLESHHCRFPCWSDAAPPIEEPAFCGAKKVPGTSYCAPHLVRSTSAPQPRQRPELRVVAGKGLQVA